MPSGITDLTLSYPDFVLGTVINPDEFDQNNTEITTKVNAIIDEIDSHEDAAVLDHPDASVTTVKIADANVTTDKIADANVTTAKIADASVTTVKILDANVTTDKIADSNVTTAKIADGNITTAKIADNNITTDKILNANVTTAKIADSNVTEGKIAGSAVTTTKIANNAVTSDKILAASVTTVKLQDSGVTTAKLAADAVTTAKIADNSVTAAKVASDVPIKAELAATTQNASGATLIGIESIEGVTGTDVQGALEGLKSVCDGITNAEIPDSSIPNSKLDEDCKIGSLTDLTTIAKTDVVVAINEINYYVSNQDYGSITAINSSVDDYGSII